MCQLNSVLLNSKCIRKSVTIKTYSYVIERNHVCTCEPLLASYIDKLYCRVARLYVKLSKLTGMDGVLSMVFEDDLVGKDGLGGKDDPSGLLSSVVDLRLTSFPGTSLLGGCLGGTSLSSCKFAFSVTS